MAGFLEMACKIPVELLKAQLLIALIFLFSCENTPRKTNLYRETPFQLDFVYLFFYKKKQ